ncbi:MAG: YdcF family protein, partial [Bdellovibrionales bacterium]|nr:YdcF family protein [Bdellovibrionales bacterium]
MKIMLVVIFGALAVVSVIGGAELYLRYLTPNFHIETDSNREALGSSSLTIVILGAGTKADQPVLADRLFCAEEAFQKWPSAKVFVSGNNVTSSEVNAMKTALLSHGVIPESALILDGSALNTRMTFENLPKAQDQRILICT